MKHRVIRIRSGGEYELWLVVYGDGRIQEHMENDGHRAMRRGLEPRDTWITMADVERHYGTTLVQQVQQALVEMAKEAAQQHAAEAASSAAQ
jgi:hypothetical protein